MEREAFEHAADANLIAFWSTYAKAPGRSFDEIDDLLWFYTGVQFPLFNGVLKIPGQQAMIARAHERLRMLIASRGAPALWWLGPQAQRSGVTRELEALGLAPAATLPCMLLELETLTGEQAPENFTITVADRTETRKEWARIAGAGTGFSAQAIASLVELEASISDAIGESQPRYLGFLDGEPVASSALVCAHGLAGVYAVATVPHARKRGIGRMMTARPLLDARTNGYRHGVLQASPMGRPIYEAMGFREIFFYRTLLQT